MKRRIATAGMATGLLASLLVATSTTASTADTTTPPSDAGVTPALVDGNPRCTDLGYDFGYKPSSGGAEDQPGTFDTPIGQVSWSYNATTKEVDWTSTPPASGVIVKGSNAANSYVYEPPGPSSSDGGLYPPVNASGGPAAISHIEFCYNFRPQVSKTATTSFKRTWDWDIVKDGDQTELTLTPGQKFLVNYTVDVTKVGPVDSDFKVSGVITITNPWPVALSVTSVTDSLVTGEVACSASTVPADGGSVTCPYSADLTSGASGTNTATVKTTAGDRPERTTTGTAPYAFATPTTELHECVTVSDVQAGGVLGDTCATTRYTYSIEIGPYTEDSTFVNTACFTSDEGSKSISDCDDHTVVIKVPSGGCTLTQGYWKTHSLMGPAPYDDAWLQVGPSGASTTFFLSGKSWYQAFWTTPAGNPYWILAHQYMAAKLNVLNGASAPAAVTSALASAETFFASKTPAQGLTLTRAKANEIKALAATLDAYNNGLTGPGHCSE
ncbi:hypothetical protein [Nocardioides aestuarii]|uniref:DUF11 domain-containing protein n=1 Tax=Nocardioides aestuarii TaxID=252231 RepID=A0ABW4TJA7_9ACTN